MAEATIRVGKISSIDYATGKARVVYEDRDNTVTVELPISQMEDTGLIREQDSVLVAHLSNGIANGIIVGRFFAKTNPVEGKKDKYRKEYSRNEEAYAEYFNKEFLMKVPKFVVETKEGREEVVPRLQDHEKRIKKLEEQVADLLRRMEKEEEISVDHERRITALEG